MGEEDLGLVIVLRARLCLVTKMEKGREKTNVIFLLGHIDWFVKWVLIIFVFIFL